MRLAITLGDPAGIGPEVVLKALDRLGDARAVLFGNWDHTVATAEAIGAELPAMHRVERASDGRDDRITFVDIATSSPPLRFGVIDAHYGAIALRSIEGAVDAIEAGFCDALITAPIQKEAILAAGSDFHGHTELLAARAGLRSYGRDFAMYFDSPRLRVALLSVHVSMREALDAISAPALVDLAKLVDRELTRLRGERPRIAVAALNPHAGEGGHFGHEEKVIATAIELAREEGLLVTGPHPADTVFLSAVRGAHDVVIALHHDQGLIPVKTLDFEHSVNVTLGLPYLRTSVDHGTAFDIAGKGVADAAPMRYALGWTAARAERMRR